jgi:hypothetical protein
MQKLTSFFKSWRNLYILLILVLLLQIIIYTYITKHFS